MQHGNSGHIFKVLYGSRQKQNTHTHTHTHTHNIRANKNEQNNKEIPASIPQKTSFKTVIVEIQRIEFEKTHIGGQQKKKKKKIPKKQNM